MVLEATDEPFEILGSLAAEIKTINIPLAGDIRLLLLLSDQSRQNPFRVWRTRKTR